ncbi:MAG: hypothetical protein LBQ66_10815 [Planctomycetaceae bacterium]|nr:hypothetical protein [Planctomycetaceae bacterium]
MGNRLPGGYVGVHADSGIAKTHRQNQHTLRFGRFGEPTRFGDPLFSACSARRKRYSPRKPGGRLPTLRLPIRFGVQFKLFWFYYTQRRAGHPRSSPRRYSSNLCGITRHPARLCALGNQTSSEGTPRRVGEYLPPCLGVQFKLFWCYCAQRRAGCPRSSPSPRCGELMWYNEASRPPLCIRKPNEFGRNAKTCWRT